MTIDELEQVISYLDTCYEEGSDCINPLTNKLVSDSEYDLLRKQLSDLAPDSPVLKTVTASNLKLNVKKVAHNPPMTSISKAIGTLSEREATLQDWMDKVQKELGKCEIVQAYKRDGVAIALYYENGKLKAAGLRPRDGVSGEDVTENAKYVEGIPAELWEHDSQGNKKNFLNVTCCIRGEIECKKSVFEEIVVNWQKYGLSNEPANPRNYAAGSIRQFTDPKETKNRRISFTGYSVFGWNNAPFKTEIERAKYVNAVLRIPFVQVRPFRQQDLKSMEDFVPQLDYEVDGIVLSVNNLEDSEQMGTHGNSVTGNPKGKLAWKFSEQSAVVTVKGYEFALGRSGRLTPVLNFDAVPLDGTKVSQCTAHSLGFMDGTSASSLGEIGVGAQIRIIKSGKIIPKVIEIVSEGQPLIVPSKCPSCGGKLDIIQGNDGKNLVCPDEYCGDRAVAHLCYYLTTIGVKGLAESIVGDMYRANLVKHPCDFYKVTVNELQQVGFTERQALLAVSRIWMADDAAHQEDDALKKFISKTKKLKVPAWQIFASQGIPTAGKSAGKALMDHFGSLENLRKATLDDLKSVPDVGEITAQKIVEYFAKYGKLFDVLLEYLEPEGPKQGKLSGKSFVFTGGFTNGKAFHEKRVMDCGGKVSGNVSKNTDYLVVGTDAGSKEEKAKQLGVKRISIDELEKML